MSVASARVRKSAANPLMSVRSAHTTSKTNKRDSTSEISIADWIRAASRKLARGGKNGKLFFGHGALNAIDEAAWMAAHACRLSPMRLQRHMGRRMTSSEARRANEYVARRIEDKVPLAYLLGEAWLNGRRFVVDRRVIVPRSLIVECMEEQILPWIANVTRVTRVLDLCTGSGCLAILAAKIFSGARVDAIDISADALSVARENIQLHRLAPRVRAVRSDLFREIASRRYDLIISNPPYVDEPSMRVLPDEYRREPSLALAGGRDGLDLVRRILADARQHLKPGGVLVMEIGHNRRVLERAFPRIPFVWLDSSAGPDKVFLLPADDLPPANRQN